MTKLPVIAEALITPAPVVAPKVITPVPTEVLV